MDYFQLNMEIIDHINEVYILMISYEKSTCKISFSPKTKDLEYLEKNELTQFIKLKEFQLRKLLHNKKPKSYFIGFKLNFVLHNGLPDAKFYDRNKITVLDNTKNQFIVNKTDHKKTNIIELFTDGSYNQETKRGGYAFLIKTLQNEYFLNQIETSEKGNNLIELLAVIEGLKYLHNEKEIRVITDSQYVIKGITEWLPLWKINNFYTVNGTKAKNISKWKEIDNLITGKYLEFEWVKSHSEHFENTICDLKAKSTYNNKKYNEEN